MKYVAVLGRQPELSAAEIEAQFGAVRWLTAGAVEFSSPSLAQQTSANETQTPIQQAELDGIDINRLGGTLKIFRPLEVEPIELLRDLPDGKITLGVSNYDKKATPRNTAQLALKLKKQAGRSVRLLPNRTAVLGTAAVLHNKLGQSPRKIELAKIGGQWMVGCGVQNIDAYTRRDQARPARDAKVGMLPPKLAQILINLAGQLPAGARVLDPFCGTGVVLQEAALMGYTPYGTDASERMVEYSQKNLEWLRQHWAKAGRAQQALDNSLGDATNYQWQPPIDAVVCETYLGPPMSQPPAEIKLKEVQQEIRRLLLKFLKNLSGQIKSGTPVVLAVPAWLRRDGSYARLGQSPTQAPQNSRAAVNITDVLLDEIKQMGYNEVKYSCQRGKDLLYHREGQIVARQIIILRKS